MRHRTLAVATAALMALAPITGPTAHAQSTQQQVVPAPVVYWMGVKTQSGMAGMAGGGSGMGAAIGMMRSASQSNATMSLELGSRTAPTGRPQASHTVPAGARIGPQLPLVTPQRARPVEPGGPEQSEMPEIRGRLLLFFGCGERARAGQPVVIDFARMARGQMPAGLQSRVAAARVSSFNPSNWRTVGYWPNPEDNRQTVLPAGASLAGQHVIRGTYSPEISFALGGPNDVMAPINLSTNRRNPSGSVALGWQPIANATGYYAMAMGQGQTENDMVFWTSSEVQTFDAGTNDYIPPGEVARLIRERVVMAPATTSCTVPQEAVQAMSGGGGAGPGGAMLFFNAFGPEANFVHPARPTDPRTPWVQEWTVKARFHSFSMEMLGQSFADMMGASAGGSQGAPGTATDPCAPQQAPPNARGSLGEAIGSATGIPGGGMLGRAIGNRSRRAAEPAPPANPNCPAPAQQPAGRR